MTEENIISRLLNLERQHTSLQRKLQNRTLFLILFFGICIVSLLTYDIFYLPGNKINPDQFVTQNLRGDSVDTWFYWNILDQDSAFHIHVINDAKVNEEKMQVIYESVLSNESIQIDDLILHKGPTGGVSNFYLGWAGVMNAASKVNTKYFFPTNFHVHENSQGGDIIITLTKSKSTEGYSGYTRSLTDKNQILKSYITIYQADTLSDNQLATILRHELGHSFGLIHSTDPNDLMYEKIITNIPYISECSIEALRELYNGKTEHSYTCQK